MINTTFNPEQEYQYTFDLNTFLSQLLKPFYVFKKPTPGLPCSMWRQRVILPARRITETVYTEADTERSERQSGILKQQQIHTVLPKMLNGSYHFVTHTSHLKMLDLYLI